MSAKRILCAMSASSVRLLISGANREGIQRDDVIGIYREGDEFVLVYYRAIDE